MCISCDKKELCMTILRRSQENPNSYAILLDFKNPIYYIILNIQHSKNVTNKNLQKLG